MINLSTDAGCLDPPGQQVAQVVIGEVDAGYHEVRFDVSGLASGLCFYRIEAGDSIQTRKLLLLR